MKNLILLTALVIFCLNSSNAQEQDQQKKSYKTWVSLNNVPSKLEGVLYDVNDSAKKASNSIIIQKVPTDIFSKVRVNVENINTIQVRRKNNVGRGILWGAVSGFVLGGITGLTVINGGQPKIGSDSVGNAFMLGAPLAIVGSGMGALAGSAKITIPIFGSKKNYHKSMDQLKQIAMK